MFSRTPGRFRALTTTSSTQPSSRRVGRAVVAVSATALTLGVGSAAASPEQTTSVVTAVTSKPIIFGASGGDEVTKLASKIGAPLATHVYAQLNGPVHIGRLTNVAPNVPWRTVASAQPGSAVFGNIARWADALKARSGRPVLFTFSHEPEGHSSDDLGTASEFIAAFRRVENIFKARGVQNVEYTWNMTSNAFRVKSSDGRYAPKWYPGDAYVDNVATAAYNWYNCGEGTGKWLSLGHQAAAPLAFARSHDKTYVLAEWASQADPRRAAWLKTARDWFLANKADIRGAFYYQTPSPRAGCSWKLTTTAELDAFAKMVKDRWNFGG